MDHLVGVFEFLWSVAISSTAGGTAGFRCCRGSLSGIPDADELETVVKSRLLFKRYWLDRQATTLESLTRISLMVIVSFSNVETGTAMVPSFVSNLRRQTADSPLETNVREDPVPMSSGQQPANTADRPGADTASENREDASWKQLREEWAIGAGTESDQRSED